MMVFEAGGDVKGQRNNAGFVLFRVFDIWKPWPICVADAKVSGGLGVMLDDVIAGIYALILMKLIGLLMGVPLW